MDIDQYIFGNVLMQQREAKGITRSQMAQKLCCSKTQIQQVEEGGNSSFYTQSQKLSTAKKMAAYLDLPLDQVMVDEIPKLMTDESKTFDYYEQESKQTSYSRLSLGLSSLGLVLLGVLGFFVYNLLSPDFNLYTNNSIQQKELMAINPPTEETKSTIEAGSLQSNDMNTVTNDSVDPCQIQKQNTAVFTPTQGNFVGNFVVFVSKTEQTICVVDGLGNKQTVTLVPYQNKIVSGVGPFSILGNQLKQIDTYYQGWKVNNLQANTDSIQLNEVPLRPRSDSLKAAVTNQADSSLQVINPQILKSTSKNESNGILQNVSGPANDASASQTSSQE
jgi:transcriptional regulator with XRE-family HTH domain